MVGSKDDGKALIFPSSLLSAPRKARLPPARKLNVCSAEGELGTDVLSIKDKTVLPAPAPNIFGSVEIVAKLGSTIKPTSIPSKPMIDKSPGTLNANFLALLIVASAENHSTKIPDIVDIF